MIFAFATLGCKVNHYETEAMRESFLAAGWTEAPFTESADVYLVNTCTVTQTSDAKSRNLIARAHRTNPHALIVVLGCYAQTSAEAVSKLEGVGLVLGADGRKDVVARVEEALAAGGKQMLVKPLATLRTFETLSAVRDSRTRATLKIQDGCVNFCSYCAIPYARGPLRSRPLASIRAEMAALDAEGYREVVLTGIHLASYGRDSGEGDLLDAIAAASRTSGVTRIRLGSLEPKFIDERAADALANNPRVCRQFHLSLQSGSDAVLSRMNRRYTTAAYAEAVSLLRARMPACAITTDVIAGFCGETDEEHRETLDFCRTIGFARMHVFPFSVRAGTKAATLPDRVPRKLREARAAALIALGETLREDYLTQQLGSEVEVLAETGGEGYSGNYIRVRTNAPEGTIARIRLTGFDHDIAYGEELT